MATHQNTHIISLLENKLTERLGDYGSPRPLFISLWEDEQPIQEFFQFLFNYFGLRRFINIQTNYTGLTVRFSEATGYTLEGPSWQEISRRTGLSITDFFNKIGHNIKQEWEAAHGWEQSLADTLTELDAL